MTKERLIELVNNVKNAVIDEIPDEPMSGGQLLVLGYAAVSVVAKGLDMDPNEVCVLIAISFDGDGKFLMQEALEQISLVSGTVTAACYLILDIFD